VLEVEEEVVELALVELELDVELLLEVEEEDVEEDVEETDVRQTYSLRPLSPASVKSPSLFKSTQPKYP